MRFNSDGKAGSLVYGFPSAKGTCGTQVGQKLVLESVASRHQDRGAFLTGWNPSSMRIATPIR